MVELIKYPNTSCTGFPVADSEGERIYTPAFSNASAPLASVIVLNTSTMLASRTPVPTTVFPSAVDPALHRAFLGGINAALCQVT